MKNTKSTKRALLSAILALVMTVSMLVGTTFAWFTDSVTSSGNKIVAGNLDVELYMFSKASGDYENISNKAEPIFGAGGLIQQYDSNVSMLWEPGKTQVVYLAIKNAGDLALKYQVSIDVKDIKEDLNEVLYYTVTPDAMPNDITAWDGSEASQFDGEGEYVVSDGSVPMAPGAWHYFALTVHMDELAGNSYMNGEITFDLTILATQLGDDTLAENDSFGNDYDKEAEYPLIVSNSFSSESAAPMPLTLEGVTVTVPADAEDGVYTLQVDSVTETENENGEITLMSEISLLRNGSSVNSDGKSFAITLAVEPMSNITSVYHKDTEITNYTYDYFTGLITFETTSFSPFSVTYETFGTQLDLDLENREINGGTFEGIDPTTVDSSLGEADSDYIVVDYVKDGTKYYIVSEKATTVILAPGTLDAYLDPNDPTKYTYDFLNTDLPEGMIRENSSGNLYKIFNSGYSHAGYYGFGASYDPHNVYLLPGTYSEGTTINIYCNATIMGLGDTDDVKVVKVKGSNSNRHLFNVNGAVTGEKHIEVTIQNLYIDASAKNLNSKGTLYTMDNAAVQSIRLSKVKCYDLNIVKSSGFAFYVNGKYDARGAYLYAENCKTSTSSMLDTANPYLFYYNNLTYKSTNVPYTTTSSTIKNAYLAYDEWDWSKAQIIK